MALYLSMEERASSLYLPHVGSGGKHLPWFDAGWFRQSPKPALDGSSTACRGSRKPSARRRFRCDRVMWSFLDCEPWCVGNDWLACGRESRTLPPRVARTGHLDALKVFARQERQKAPIANPIGIAERSRPRCSAACRRARSWAIGRERGHGCDRSITATGGGDWRP